MAEPIRYNIEEAADLLRMSRAQLYQRIRHGEIRAHEDGRRRYISAAAVKEYVARLDVAGEVPRNAR